MWLHRIVNRLRSDIYLLFNGYKFKSLGKRVRIIAPLKIDGKSNISIGENSMVRQGTWLASLPLTGDYAHLQIGTNCHLGHYNHIYCTSSIIIEDNVLTADKVYIADNAHNYEDIDTPIWRQSIKQLNCVRIGESSWIGENVCVIGASIGRHCVIGANSVVTKDIPDYSVAVGAPARIIKKYNHLSRRWERV